MITSPQFEPNDKSYFKLLLFTLPFAAIVIYCIINSGCTNARKAIKYFDKHKAVAEAYNQAHYPCQDSVHESIVYKEGETITRVDSFTNTDTFNFHDTTLIEREKTRTVTKTVHDTVEKERVVYQTNKEQIENLTIRCDSFSKAYIKQGDKLAAANHWRNWFWILVAIIAVLVLLKIKRII